MKKQYYTLATYQRSKGDGYWQVKIDQDGFLSCNCPSWIYKVNGQRNCKHLTLAREEFGDKIEAVKQYGLSEVASPVLPVG